MKKQKKTFLALLGATTLLWSGSTGITSAEIEGYVAKSNNTLYYYSVDDLVRSGTDYIIDPKSTGSKLWQHFISGQAVALYDSKRGYVDYKDVLSAYSSSRNLKEYTENNALLYSALPETIKTATLSSNGQIIEVDRQTGSTWNITITNVTVLNETTVQVDLSDVLSSVPDAARFSVKVDGSLTTISKVTQVGSDKKKYNLTISSLAGKEGSLSVNSRAASIPGSDFGYDFKGPSVISAVGIDQKRMLVTFSEKVTKASAETKTNYELSKADGSPLSGATSVTPVSAILQPDGKTVILTTAGIMTNKSNDSKVTVLASGSSTTAIQDVLGNRMPTTETRTFTGAGLDTDTTTGDSIVYTP
ncbi:hypothetical protein [Aneurinibacillus uraniidurans]|uniref:hypothetical protein n=1 Tax=Aneurinibacillus uraniidurans TaxID=2966586 RepID=UPI00234B28BE|nr:hypothetical protein [Aneurinibacillus sp. B1]WCN39287.1 hypothetical protein PO771_07815 [Aneurinibacillus sp. B1]